MVVRGYACYILFSSVDAEDRFKKWVLRGNARCDAMGVSSLGLTAQTYLVSPHKYLFLWHHVFMFDLGVFLRFMLWLQFRNVRKFVTFIPVRKLELVSLVMERGLS